MTVGEFLIKYHDYNTQDINEANKECEKVNRELEVTQHGPATVVYLGNLEYCLMLKGAADLIREIGLI